MKIKCPALDIDDDCNVNLIHRIVKEIVDEEDSFFILERDDMIYIQAYYDGEGFILEYQEGSLDKHYISKKALTSNEIINVFLEYSNNSEAWKRSIEFEKD